MGLLGLLSVAAWRWRRHAMPALSRTVLINLALIAGVGAIGTGIIDNAAHLGGVVGGVLAGMAIVPRDPGPRATGVWWDWADRLAIAVLVAAIGGAGWLVWHASGGG
jgi:membrane associated rhomboid family serine protease